MTEEERYRTLANERQVALDNSNKTYNDLINQNNQFTQTVNDNLARQQQIQNDQLDKQTQFIVDKQNQNIEKAQKEYDKEAIASKNAYYDFINPYGVQAEIQAQNGLKGTGYSETTKSQAWTTQQNRTAQARATMNEAKLQFEDAIKEAYLNNDANKAQLALEILKQQQEEALRSFNYVSTTEQNRLSNNQGLDSDYNNRYNTLYSQIQNEKATQEAIRQWEAEMAEQKRQYDDTMAYKKEQDRIAQQQWEKEYALNRYKAYSSNNSSSGTILSNGSSGNLTDSGTGMSFTDKNGNVITTDSNGNVTVKQSDTSSKVYSAMSSPASFSSNTAREWFTKNVSGKKFTETQLESLLETGRKENKINNKDIDRILKTYGM